MLKAERKEGVLLYCFIMHFVYLNLFYCFIYCSLLPQGMHLHSFCCCGNDRQHVYTHTNISALVPKHDSILNFTLDIWMYRIWPYSKFIVFRLRHVGYFDIIQALGVVFISLAV